MYIYVYATIAAYRQPTSPTQWSIAIGKRRPLCGQGSPSRTTTRSTVIALDQSASQAAD